jgi:hypothetical protein
MKEKHWVCSLAHANFIMLSGEHLEAGFVSTPTPIKGVDTGLVHNPTALKLSFLDDIV